MIKRIWKWLVTKTAVWMSRFNIGHGIDDERYLKVLYRLIKGKKLNLENPITFNEKMQWLKLFDRKPEYTIMVDKFAVKNYVANLIGEEYLIPTLGRWESFDSIDFENLPQKFVLKNTHDSGGIVFCKNKAELDLKAAKRKMEKSLKSNYFYWGREWPYKDIKPQIIAEQFMEDVGDNTEAIKGLKDYKYFCFNGEPRFLYLSKGLDNHSTALIDYVSLDWEKEEFYRKDYARFEELPSKPVNFEKMIEISKILSKDIPFVRIDLYEINQKIYFSEFTFTPGSGFSDFHPDEWNEIIGSWLNLPTTRTKDNRN